MAEKMKFIRKNGKVIPVGPKKGGDNSAKKKNKAVKSVSKKSKFFSKEGVKSQKSKFVIKANAAFDRSLFGETKEARNKADDKYLKYQSKATKLGATDDDFADSQNQKAGRRYNQAVHGSSI